jgi:lipopolysaccharide transport system permease protein
MARFGGVGAKVDGNAIRVSFRLDAPCVVGWQIYDPSTGAFLFEGEWREVRDTNVELSVALPEQEGPYRVQVAPVEDRRRFVLIDAQVSGAGIVMSAPRVTTAGALRRRWLLGAIPKAFTRPPATLWRNRKLIRSMVRRDILARYRGSFGGAMWTFLNPLLLMATYTFVFGVVLKTKFEGDATGIGWVLYFLAGMLPWLAFSEAVGRAPSIILEYRNFVKKLVFPLETLPANLVISGAVTETFTLAIFLLGLVLARHSIPASVLWLPALIVPQLLLTAGVCWILAALGIFMRDLGTIMGFVLTLWFFVTPICYPEASLAGLPHVALRILTLNPMFQLVEGYRAVLLENRAPGLKSLVGLWIASPALAVIGYAWFHRLQKSFADVI